LCFGFSYLLNYNFVVRAVPWKIKFASDFICDTVLFFWLRVPKLRFHPLLISRCQQPEFKPKDKDLRDGEKIDMESRKRTNPSETVEAKIKVKLQFVVCCARGPFTVFATYAASAQAELQ